MFSARIILASVFIFITAFSAQAQKRDVKDWSIADYFKNLPEKYITASGDFLKPSKETVVVDEKNGYAAAYLNSPPQMESGKALYPIFEMALFKSQTKPALLVVANTKSDSVCAEYETFFSNSSCIFFSCPLSLVFEDFLPTGRPKITPSAFFLASASLVR